MIPLYSSSSLLQPEDRFEKNKKKVQIFTVGCMHTMLKLSAYGYIEDFCLKSVEMNFSNQFRIAVLQKTEMILPD